MKPAPVLERRQPVIAFLRDAEAELMLAVYDATRLHNDRVAGRVPFRGASQRALNLWRRADRPPFERTELDR